jgi:predicted deacylase
MIALFVEGTMNVLKHHKVIEGNMGKTGKDSGIFTGDGMAPVLTSHGGFIELHVELNEQVQAGQKLATQRNSFGEVVAEYSAPVAGKVGARRTDASCEPGTPIVFLIFDSATATGTGGLAE